MRLALILALAGFGVGLAVPVNATTRGIVDALMTRGRVRRAWLGIAGTQVTVIPEVAAKLGSRTGLQVVEVSTGSPAAEAGLRRGDVVVSLDGNPVVTTTAVQRLMVEDAIDRRIEITVWRNGALVDVLARGFVLRDEREATLVQQRLGHHRHGRLAHPTVQ